MNHLCNIQGEVTLVRYKNAVPFQTIFVRNKIVNGGLNFFVNKIAGNTTGQITKMKIGTDSRATELEYTDLFGNTIVTNPIRFIGIPSANFGEIIFETYFDTTFDDPDTFTIVEIGLFAEDDTMIARTVLEENNRFSKTPEETLSLSWRIIFGGENET